MRTKRLPAIQHLKLPPAPNGKEVSKSLSLNLKRKGSQGSKDFKSCPFGGRRLSPHFVQRPCELFQGRDGNGWPLLGKTRNMYII